MRALFLCLALAACAQEPERPWYETSYPACADGYYPAEIFPDTDAYSGAPFTCEPVSAEPAPVPSPHSTPRPDQAH